MRKTIILTLAFMLVVGLSLGTAAQDIKIGLAVSTLNNPFLLI